MSRKGENIYKRKDGRWEARYPKGYTEKGSIRYGYCYGKTYHEAKEKLLKLKNESFVVNSNNKMNKKRFATYCDEWLQLSKIKVKESTLVKYTTSIEKHVKPLLGGYYVHMLNSLIIEKFSHTLIFDRKLSAKTVRDILSMIKSIIKYISMEVPNLPKINISYSQKAPSDIRVLSIDEQTRLTEYLLKDMDRSKFGVLLSLMTGMRIGEICALRWSDFSFEDMTIRVSSTMQRLKDLEAISNNKTKIVISYPKSNASTRIIPMTEYCVSICKRWYTTNSDSFILTGSNNFVEPRTLQYRFEKYVKDCNLDGVHFHVLRHTFATRCVEVGFEIKSLSEILGHSSPQITLERYVHSSIKLKRDNMNKLAAIGY